MTLAFRNRLGADLDEMPQNVGAALAWVQRNCCVDGRGEIIGLGYAPGESDRNVHGERTILSER